MRGALGRLVPAILGWLAVIVTLALAPTIETYNGYITTNVSTATNSSYMIGMPAISPWGGFIMIISLLLGTGIFAYSGMKSKNVTVGDLIGIIGAVIISVFALSVVGDSVLSNIDALITAGGASVKAIYGTLMIIIYAGVIGGAGAYAGVKGMRKGRKSKSSSRYM